MKRRVAELTADEKAKELRAFYSSLWANAKVGDYIDAVDSVHKWCLGQVVARDDQAVKCHFDGWSSRWDSAFRWTSCKIAPLRRYSIGYTGQVKIPLRAGMQLEIESCQNERDYVLSLIKNDFRGLTAYELTQYLRGKLFVYVDFVMGQGGQSYTEEEAVAVDQLLRAVLRLIVAWLNKLPQIMQKCLEEHRRDPELYLVDEDLALCNSCPELMALLKWIFCGCH